MKALTSKDLWRWFKLYNRCFFDKRVPTPYELEFSCLDEYESNGLTMKGSIYIDSALKKNPRVVEIFLIHEMIHLLLGDEYRPHHGARFHAEQVRLMNAGAYEGLL